MGFVEHGTPRTFGLDRIHRKIKALLLQDLATGSAVFFSPRVIDIVLLSVIELPPSNSPTNVLFIFIPLSSSSSLIILALR